MKPFEKKHSDLTESTTTIKLYSDCHKLMLDRFIQIIAEGDLKLLIISGKPSQELLEETWSNIYADYIGLIRDDGAKEMYKAQRDIIQWQNKFDRIEMIVQLLAKRPFTGLIELLKKMGYSYAFNYNDMASYWADLNAVYQRSKTLLSQIVLRKKDLDRLQEKDAKAEKVEPVDQFDIMLISLSEHYKYEVQPHNLTVARFAKMMNRVKEYAKNLDNKIRSQEKGGGKWKAQ